MIKHDKRSRFRPVSRCSNQSHLVGLFKCAPSENRDGRMLLEPRVVPSFEEN